MPKLTVIGGPNGAGKSTFIREFLRSHSHRYLCADEAAFELCPDDPESVAVAAGRLFLQRMTEARVSGEDVIVESTLSGRSFRKTIQAYSDAGYSIEMIFVTPLDEDASVDRVAARVKKGGHHVPEADIRRRFTRSHANFWEIYRLFANSGWNLVVNTSAQRRTRIAGGWQHGVEVYEEELFVQFLHLVYTAKGI